MPITCFKVNVPTTPADDSTCTKANGKDPSYFSFVTHAETELFKLDEKNAGSATLYILGKQRLVTNGIFAEEQKLRYEL